MNWTSRFGSWGGRFSPFGRPESEYDNLNSNKNSAHGSAPSEAKVSDGDFSYITSADLAAVDEAGGLEPQQQPASSQGQYNSAYKQKNGHQVYHQHHQQKHNETPRAGTGVPTNNSATDNSSAVEAASPDRETDILVLKHKRVTHPVHFPAFSIARGELRIGEIRSRAAQRLKVHAPRKVKLLHRGRNLRDDGQTAQEAGLAAGGEIMCIVGSSASSEGNHPGHSSGTGGTSDADYDREYDHNSYHDNKTAAYHYTTNGSADVSSADAGADSSTPSVKGSSSGGRRRRTRQKKKQNKHHRDSSTNPPLDGSSESTFDNHRHPPHPPRSHPVASQSAAPTTPLGQLSALANTFRADLLPQCLAFESHPPSDTAKRDFEHRRLTETVLAQVLLKLDAVETEGDAEARKMRKELVKECQSVLGRLDEVMK